MAVVAILTAGLVGLAARWFGVRAATAWLLGAAVLPVAVLVTEFAFAPADGGASMWPIALVVGAVVGGAASAVGVWLASRFPSRSPSA